MDKSKPRNLVEPYAIMIFILAVWLGVGQIIGRSQSEKTPLFAYTWEMPGAPWVWAIPPMLFGMIGLGGVIFKRYKFALFASAGASGWAFIYSLFLFAALTNPQTVLLWPPVMLFLSAAYTILALRFLERVIP